MMARRGIDVVVVLERCRTAACCKRFVLGASWAEVLASADFQRGRFRGGLVTLIEDAPRAAELFVPLGVLPMVHSGESAEHFTCRALCPRTGNCTAYSTRPMVCRTLGVYEPCDFPGCTIKVQVNPLTVPEVRWADMLPAPDGLLAQVVSMALRGLGIPARFVGGDHG